MLLELPQLVTFCYMAFSSQARMLEEKVKGLLKKHFRYELASYHHLSLLNNNPNVQLHTTWCWNCPALRESVRHLCINLSGTSIIYPTHSLLFRFLISFGECCSQLGRKNGCMLSKEFDEERNKKKINSQQEVQLAIMGQNKLARLYFSIIHLAI